MLLNFHIFNYWNVITQRYNYMVCLQFELTNDWVDDFHTVFHNVFLICV